MRKFTRAKLERKEITHMPNKQNTILFGVYHSNPLPKHKVYILYS